MWQPELITRLLATEAGPAAARKLNGNGEAAVHMAAGESTTKALWAFLEFDPTLLKLRTGEGREHRSPGLTVLHLATADNVRLVLGTEGGRDLVPLQRDRDPCRSRQALS